MSEKQPIEVIDLTETESSQENIETVHDEENVIIEIVDDDDENSNLDDKNPKEVSVEKMVDNVKKPRGRPKKLLNRNKGIRTQTNGDGNSSQDIGIVLDNQKMHF